MSLSKRAKFCHDYPNIVYDYCKKYFDNRYDKENNPRGIVNIGLAENTLCEDILQEKLNQPETFAIEPWQQYYGNNIGTHRCRKSVAKFMSKYFKAAEPLHPDHLILTCGVGAALEFMAFAFAEPGDCFLLPAPCYSGIRRDIEESGESFQLPSQLLEDTYQSAIEQGENVKGVIIPNPHNPTGSIFNRNSLQNLLEFGVRHDLHIIMDEIFALSVFGENAKSESILTFDNVPDDQKLHLVWGFSKDLALSGFRVGVIHSKNEYLAQALNEPCYLGGVPPIIQGAICRLLDDEEWLDNTYFPTNLARIREAYTFTKDRLTKLGICCHPSPRPFFIWADLTKFVLTKEGEMELFEQIFENKVYVVPGFLLDSPETGRFRVTFTTNIDELDIAMSRMEKVLSSWTPKKSAQCDSESCYANVRRCCK